MAQSCKTTIAAAVCLIALSAAPFAAAAAIDIPDAGAAIGQWDLSLNDTNRKCRLMLRDEPADKGLALAMPAGCRRAMPILSEVGGWTSAGRDQLGMLDRAGNQVLAFAPAPDRDIMLAKGPEGETYELAPAMQRPPVRLAQAGASAPGFQVITPPAAAPRAAVTAQAAPAPSASAAPPARTGEIAGRYAILREGKDTNCMLTLDDKARGLKGNKAQLAPACRDQGLVIFDPAGWSLERGRLVLTARKGHQTHFDRNADGVWMKDPKEGKNLGLKRL